MNPSAITFQSLVAEEAIVKAQQKQRRQERTERKREYPIRLRSAEHVAELLLSKINQEGSGCHEWTGHRNACGYGVFGMGASMLAHRVVYTLLVGPIPAGLQVLHTCDNPGCCRKEHLFLGSHTVNMIDCSMKGRGAIQKLMPSDVLEIRRLHAASKPIGHKKVPPGVNRALAARYGLHYGTIAHIVNGSKWTHLTS